jgi:mono/diheme cytochrome c family protein
MKKWMLPAIALLSMRAAEVDFESRVRPLLANSCYTCHTQTAMGGLRVDSRDALLKGGKSGPAIVPGDPDASLLVRAVRHAEGAPKMPLGGQLKKDDVETLVAWVKSGAVWPDTPAPTVKSEAKSFWSFQPLRHPDPPAVKNTAWAKTTIDRFILARLEQEGLKPAPPADRRTLLRRASLDLTGLPPTADEIKTFEADRAPDAFAKAIDRLLASPQYGERWGRMWLDVARYGEDDYRSLDPMRRGYNPYPNAYLYRDWVIQSLNDDVPYGDFVRAQLAADLLPADQRIRNLPALGFLGLGPWFYDNGAVEITRADERHDRVDAVSRGFLGLTVACARCHDHKYDPIPQKDYYALAGVFANTVYHEYPQAPKSVAEEYDRKEKLVEKKEKLLGEFMSTESTQLAESLAFQATRYMRAAWKVTGEQKEDLAAVADQDKLDYELLDRWVKFLAKPPKFYPYLTDWQKMIATGGTASEAKKLADAFQERLVDTIFARHELKEENDIIAAKALPTTKPRKFAEKPNEFVTNDDFCPGCGLSLKSLPIEQMNLWTDVFQRDLRDGFDPAQSFEKRTPPGLLVFRGWSLERRLSAERLEYIKALREDIAAMHKAVPPHYPFVHGVVDAEKPANLQVALRGNPMNLGDEVPRHFLSALSEGTPAPLTKGSGRLELADLIVKQPLAMRVIVNRIWKGHFGTGLVDTPSNFGVIGERPSHPDLLEYLASSFVENGMSLKKLHRDLMLSATYQMSDAFTQAAYDKDSGNRLYWRANRRRLDAEQIRDAMLSVSAALDTKMGGPSVDLTPAAKRRTIYAKVSRFRLDEYLQLFDFPSPAQTAEKRHVTTVPLQRLFFLNSDFVEQQAELVARRTEGEPDQPARIRKLYSILYGRTPTAQELDAGVEFLNSEPMKSYEERKAAQKDKPKKETPPDDAEGDEDKAPKPESMMAGVTAPSGPRKPEDKLLPVTSWGRYAKVLLSSAEFLYIN